jgi:outer membrane lipoprotein LolB
MRILVISLIFGVFCVGCTTISPQPPVAIEHLATIKKFELKGRMAIRHNGEGFSGSLQWQHQLTKDEVEIYGPLSQTIARISKDDKQVRLQTSDQKEFRANDVETLTENIVGWRLPLQGLQYWVLGLAQPGIPAEIKRDAQQRIIYLAQNGWRIEFQRYQIERGLPDKLTLRYGDDLEIRLVIDQWLIGQI